MEKSPLEDIDYPATKQEIIAHALTTGLPDEYVQLLKQISDRTFQNANEIDQEIARTY